MAPSIAHLLFDLTFYIHVGEAMNTHLASLTEGQRMGHARGYECHVKKLNLPLTCVLSIHESCRNVGASVTPAAVSSVGRAAQMRSSGPIPGAPDLGPNELLQKYRWFPVTPNACVLCPWIVYRRGGRRQIPPTGLIIPSTLLWEFVARAHLECICKYIYLFREHHGCLS